MTTHVINMFRILISTLLVLVGLAAAALVMALQFQPIVPVGRALDNVDINAIEQLIVDNAPERISSAGERTVHLDRAELNLLTAFVLQTAPGMQDMAADVKLQSGQAIIEVSAPIHLPFTTLYLNLRTQLM